MLETGSVDEPGCDGAVQLISVDGLQDPAERRLARRPTGGPGSTDPEPHPHRDRQVMGPFRDRDIRACSGQDSAHRRGQDGDQPVAHPAGPARIGHRGQCHQQIRAQPRHGRGVHRTGCRVAVGGEHGDRRGWTSGHGGTPSDQRRGQSRDDHSCRRARPTPSTACHRADTPLNATLPTPCSVRANLRCWSIKLRNRPL